MYAAGLVRTYNRWNTDEQRKGYNVMRTRFDKKHSFYSCFDEKTGRYFRSGILSGKKDTGEDPFMSSFPELLDVGIMGHCEHGLSGLCACSGVQCYQSGGENMQPNMALEDFMDILHQCHKDTYQIALGGRGDPDMHEHFEEILAACRAHRVVPNFTSSGYGFTEKTAELCKQYCGAVAISWYRNSYTEKAIDLLLDAGVKTNIHYVLGKNSIDEAVWRLKHKKYPSGINALVFLLHKPVGMGAMENVLSEADMTEFFTMVDREDFPFRVGFDSCTVPGLIRHCPNIALESVDTCEGGRWSAYISPDMTMMPCSFDNQQKRWAVSLRTSTIQEAWDSPLFNDFRNRLRSGCTDCDKKHICMGGCPITPEIVLCEQKRRY